MMDHVLVFASEGVAHAALDPLGHGGIGDDGAYWNGSYTIPNQFIGNDTIGKLPGFWITVALPEQSEALKALPGNACRFIADREASTPGVPVFAYVAPDTDHGLLASCEVSPRFLGSNY